MDILLSKYGLIFTEFESIDLGSASLNTVKFSKYQTIFTEQKVHDCILFELQTGNMVWYTLSGFYIPRTGRSYKTILPFWSWNNSFVILQILYKTPF